MNCMLGMVFGLLAWGIFLKWLIREIEEWAR